MQNITYILTSLANLAAHELLFESSSLKKAGEETRPLHPLSFLQFALSDPRLTVCIRKIPSRPWAGKEFMGGMVATIKEEYARKNFTQDMINDFANSIGIDVRVINPAYKARKWETFVHQCINAVPREEGYDRYNM